MKFLTPAEQKEFEQAIIDFGEQKEGETDYKPEEDNQKELFNNE